MKIKGLDFVESSPVIMESIKSAGIKNVNIIQIKELLAKNEILAAIKEDPIKGVKSLVDTIKKHPNFEKLNADFFVKEINIGKQKLE